MMALANLKVSRKLALGLACVLVVFAVTSTAFFFTLLSIDHANEEVAAATSLNKHVVQATSAIVDQSQPGSAASRGSEADAERRFADEMAGARRVVEAASEQAAIGKDLDDYDALDMGVFVCAPAVFGALDEACRGSDTTLSGGIRQLARRGLVRGIEIGSGGWCDVDTVGDLAAAEMLLRRPRHARTESP